jgi:hypothetical protein
MTGDPAPGLNPGVVFDFDFDLPSEFSLFSSDDSATFASVPSFLGPV